MFPRHATSHDVIGEKVGKLVRIHHYHRPKSKIIFPPQDFHKNPSHFGTTLQQK